MLMTGFMVITAPFWLPVYAVGVAATTSVYVIGAAALVAVAL